MTATDARHVVARQMDRSGNALILALAPLDDAEFFAANPNGFSAAWVVGHLACVADLFCSWHDDGTLLLDSAFHNVFNETDVVANSPVSKAASVDSALYSKATLLLRFREAMVRALRVLNLFELSQWDAPAAAGVPVSLATGGAVWELWRSMSTGTAASSREAWSGFEEPTR